MLDKQQNRKDNIVHIWPHETETSIIIIIYLKLESDLKMKGIKTLRE